MAAVAPPLLAPHELDMDALALELADARRALECAVARRVNEEREGRERADGALEEMESQRRELEARIAEARKMGQVRGKEAQDMKTAVAKVSREVEELKSQEAHLPTAVETLQAALDAEAQEVDAEEAALADEESLKERKMAALRDAVACYRERLGLRFEHTKEEELVLVFTLVDHDDPKREFACKVKVSPASGEYAVTGGDPAIDEATRARLVAELNATEDFAAFVRAVRRLFRGMCR